MQGFTAYFLHMRYCALIWFEPEQHPDEGSEITFVVCTLIERLLTPGLVDPLIIISPKSD